MGLRGRAERGCALTAVGVYSDSPAYPDFWKLRHLLFRLKLIIDPLIELDRNQAASYARLGMDSTVSQGL